MSAIYSEFLRSKLSTEELNERKHREIALSERIKQGDKSARDELVLANMQFANKFAWKASFVGNQILPVEDFQQEALLAMLDCAEIFDHTRGSSFVNFAELKMRQRMSRLRRNAVVVPISELSVKNIAIVLSAVGELGGSVSVKKIAKHTGLSEKVVRIAFMNMHTHRSLDEPIGSDDDGGRSLHDVLADKNPEEILEENEEVREQRSALLAKRILDSLDKPVTNTAISDAKKRRLEEDLKYNRKIIEMYFGIGNNIKPMSYEEIGKELGINAYNVGYRFNRAMELLKSRFQKSS